MFHGLYGKNANVFAAVPESCMLPICFLDHDLCCDEPQTLVYGGVLRLHLLLGIWWTAVYPGHHYMIDVMFGILTDNSRRTANGSKKIMGKIKESLVTFGKAELTASCA